MRLPRSIGARALAAGGAVAMLLAAAGCGGDSDTSAGNAVSGDSIVSTRDVDDVGTILVDADGHALYTNEAESGGSIVCVDACADFWPPLSTDAGGDAPSAEGVSGEFGTATRPDGSEQVTLDGAPLYTFAEDQEPGAVTGDGFEDDFQGTHFIWHVVTVDDAAPDDEPAEQDDDGGGGYGY